MSFWKVSSSSVSGLVGYGSNVHGSLLGQLRTHKLMIMLHLLLIMRRYSGVTDSSSVIEEEMVFRSQQRSVEISETSNRNFSIHSLNYSLLRIGRRPEGFRV